MIEPLTRLGILINDMIWRLQKARREPMSIIHAELQQTFGVSDPTLYRWREGYSTPEPAQIIQLVRIGVTQAQMSPKWAKEMLREQRFQDTVFEIKDLIERLESSQRGGD